MKRTILVISAVVALLAAACGSTDEQFRDSLIDDGFTEEQADCALDGLEAAGIDPADLTDSALGSDEPPAEAVSITVGCLLGGDFSDLTEGLTGDDADDYGDDPALDALFDSCQAGDGAACDELYFTSPIGSRYEAFGNTCGGKVDPPPMSCEDALP